MPNISIVLMIPPMDVFIYVGLKRDIYKIAQY